MNTLKLFLFAAIVLLLGACKKSTQALENADTIISIMGSSDSISEVDDESADIEDAVSEESSEQAGSEDWDALLQSYEQLVDKYIATIKKAAKGDLSALAEYPALMEKAQEFSDKMKDAKGNMSASQWAKYNKISMKMLEAAKNMH